MSASAHSKVYCTKLILDGAGNPARCEGWPNDNSVYVHIWGPGNQERQNANPNNGGETLVRRVQARERTAATGTTPAQSRRAQVRRGETINVLWSLNNHDFDTFIQWEGRGPLAPNAAEPGYDDWINPARAIAQSPYRPAGRCASFTLGQGPLGQIMATQPNAGGGPGFGGLSEMRACWGPVRIPNNMPSGLNRLLYKWHHPPNDGRFYDSFWIDVAADGGAAPAPAPAGGNLGNAACPAESYMCHPRVYSLSHYKGLYADLRAAFGNDDQAYINHWKDNGNREGRTAHPTFEVRTYLSRYEDLRNAFGATNYKAATQHWVMNGIREGRTATAARAIVAPEPTISHTFTLGKFLKFRFSDLPYDVTAPYTATLNLTTAVKLSEPVDGVSVTNGGFTLTVQGAVLPQPDVYTAVSVLASPPESGPDSYMEDSDASAFSPGVTGAQLNGVTLAVNDEDAATAVIKFIAAGGGENAPVTAPPTSADDFHLNGAYQLVPVTAMFVVVVQALLA